MRKQASALLRACLFASLPLTAMAQAPVIVEAEDATILGSSLSIGELNGNTYITGLNGTTPPATPERVASWDIAFPAAGNYDLYVRIYVGPNVGNDDSFSSGDVGVSR